MEAVAAVVSLTAVVSLMAGSAAEDGLPPEQAHSARIAVMATNNKVAFFNSKLLSSAPRRDKPPSQREWQSAQAQ